jgi:hypothetical protein
VDGFEKLSRHGSPVRVVNQRMAFHLEKVELVSLRSVS